jgi:hypothetical protein
MNPLAAQPIPGQSLTNEPGNVPWEQPPQYVTLNEVVNLYVERLTTREGVDGLLDFVKQGGTLMDITNVLIKGAMMKGLHTIDVGFLAVPIIIELMKTICDMNGVSYVVEPEDMEKATEISEDLAKSVLDEALARVKADEDVMPASTGLMAKGGK